MYFRIGDRYLDCYLMKDAGSSLMGIGTGTGKVEIRVSSQLG